MDSAPQADTTRQQPQGVARFPASPQEELLLRIQDYFEGLGNGAIAARVRGFVEEAPLRSALAGLQQRHPKLRCSIVTAADGHRSFEVRERPPPVPFEIKDCGDGPLPWHEEANRLLNQELDVKKGPLMRLLVLRSRAQGICDIIVVAHHAIADGASALRIIEDLLEYYAEAETGGTPRPVTSLPLVTASHAHVTASLRERIACLARLARERLAKRFQGWVELPLAKQAARHPFMERHLFTEQETVALLQRCREERTTPGGALFAAAVCALADVVPDPRFRFRCRFPVNIRGMLDGSEGPVTSRDLGCFISRFEKIFTVQKPPPFWELARQIWREIETYVGGGGPQMFYNLAGRIRVKNLRRLATSAKRDTLMVNYFGTARIRGQFGSLSLEEFVTTARADNLGPLLHVWGVIIRGRLCLWNGAADVPDELWQRFHAAVHRHLRRQAGIPEAAP